MQKINLIKQKDLILKIFLHLRKVNLLNSNIESDLTLKKENSPYIINSDIKIEENVTLIIEAGTTILMNENTEIMCHGNIYALGNVNDRININH